MGKSNYIIPVNWEVYSTIEIKANSLKEAFDIAKRHIDDLPCPYESEYVDGSYRIQAETLDDMKISQKFVSMSPYVYEEVNGRIVKV